MMIMIVAMIMMMIVVMMVMYVLPVAAVGRHHGSTDRELFA